jgi:hypothetical protein
LEVSCSESLDGLSENYVVTPPPLPPTTLRHFPFLDEAAVHPLLSAGFFSPLSLTLGTYLLLSGNTF